MKKILVLVKLLAGAFLPFRSPIIRQSSRYELIRALASLFDVQVYNQLLWWHDDLEYKRMWQAFPEANKKVHERRFNLHNLVKLASGLDGDSAECGVFKGAGSHIILSGLSSLNTEHHIFDSFEGLSKPLKDDMPNGSTLPEWKEGDLSEGQEVVRKNLFKFKDRIKLYEGWIPERFDEVEGKKFCIVHIDVDLYQPTKDALEFFYPRLVRGGLIVCDDYGSRTCPGATKALDEFFSDKVESVVHLTAGTGFVVKR